MENNILSSKVISKIKEILEMELLKRGFSTEVAVEEYQHKGVNKLSVESKPFNTTPVIFKSLYIHKFSGGVIKESEKTPEVGDKAKCYEVYLNLNVRWNTFDGGSNGTNLFDIAFNIINDYVYSKQIM